MISVRAGAHVLSFGNSDCIIIVIVFQRIRRFAASGYITLQIVNQKKTSIFRTMGFKTLLKICWNAMHSQHLHVHEHEIACVCTVCLFYIVYTLEQVAMSL